MGVTLTELVPTGTPMPSVHAPAVQDGDHGKQLTQLIQQWRLLTQEHKDGEAAFDGMRRELVDFESESAAAAREWDVERAGISQTINGVREQIAVAREEQRIKQLQSAELKLKVDERRGRNDAHLRVLKERQAAVQMERKRTEVADAAAMEHLQSFREARDAARKELLDVIRRAEETLPRESSEHLARARELTRRISEIERTMQTEAQVFAVETAHREWASKTAARKILSEESSAAANGKELWAELLREASSLQINDVLDQLKAICASVTAK